MKTLKFKILFLSSMILNIFSMEKQKSLYDLIIADNNRPSTQREYKVMPRYSGKEVDGFYIYKKNNHNKFDFFFQIYNCNKECNSIKASVEKGFYNIRNVKTAVYGMEYLDKEQTFSLDKEHKSLLCTDENRDNAFKKIKDGYKDYYIKK
jgi:hypothetical protein